MILHRVLKVITTVNKLEYPKAKLYWRLSSTFLAHRQTFILRGWILSKNEYTLGKQENAFSKFSSFIRENASYLAVACGWGIRLKASTSCATLNHVSTNMCFDHWSVYRGCYKAKKHEWRCLSRKKNLCNDVHVFILERNVAFRVYSFDAENTSCSGQPIGPSVTM